jgi:hypothetical protein
VYGSAAAAQEVSFSAGGCTQCSDALRRGCGAESEDGAPWLRQGVPFFYRRPSGIAAFCCGISPAPGKKIPARKPGETIRCLTYRSVGSRSEICATLFQLAVRKRAADGNAGEVVKLTFAGTGRKPDAVKP